MSSFSATQYFYLEHRVTNFFLLIKTDKNMTVLKSLLSTLDLFFQLYQEFGS